MAASLIVVTGGLTVTVHVSGQTLYSDTALTLPVVSPQTINADTTWYVASFTTPVNVSVSWQGTQIYSVTDTCPLFVNAHARASAKATTASARAHRLGLVPPNPGTQRLLSLPSVMGSPPTVTVSAANAATAISGATRRSGLDLTATFVGAQGVTWLGAGYIDPGNIGGYVDNRRSGYLTSSSAPTRLRFETETDADTFEVAVRADAGGTAPQYRVWIDGQLVTALPQSIGGGASGGAIYRITIPLGSRGNRRVTFEGMYFTLIGIWAHPSVSFWPTSRPIGPTFVAIGDSYTEGTGGNWWWDSWIMQAGKMLGWNVIPSAVGSTGYLADGGGGGKVPYASRFLTDVVPLNPDIIGFFGGYNDTGSFTAAQEKVAAGALFALARQYCPNAAQVVAALNTPTAVTTVGTMTQFRDAIRDAAVPYADLFVDQIVYPNGTAWITGTGTSTATNGTGNADYYTSGTVASHPTQAGHDYLGRRFASAVVAAAA